MQTNNSKNNEVRNSNSISNAKKANSGTKNFFSRLGNMLAKDLWIVILDIVAVNLAYFLALMIRFYVNFQFRPTVSYYLTDFARFAPFYTVLCIVVFLLFKLYNGMWRYAGINNMNRIIAASAATCLIQILGTVFFVRRMPITYYVIGALLQFFFVAIIRFAYRFMIVEHKKISSRNAPSVNVMIVGAGEIGRRVIKQLEEDSAYRPVCVIDSKTDAEGKTFDGIPVLGTAGGIESLKKAVAMYGAKAIFIADPALSSESRESVKAFCDDKELDLQDYTGYLSNLTGRISLAALLEAAKCPVIINRGSDTKEYVSGTDALKALTDRFNVNCISANGSKLVIDLKKIRRKLMRAMKSGFRSIRKKQEKRSVISDRLS